MSVTLLLCEGESQSFDVRLLGSILRGVVGEIRPSGGKDGFPNLVKNHRRAMQSVCGICDGDFPRSPHEWRPDTSAQPWTETRQGTTVQLGWRWRRKEIENYLLDPNVLARTYAWSSEQRATYETHLNRVLDALGPPTAARSALTACAPRRVRVDTSVDVRQTRDELERELRTRAADHNSGASIDSHTLVAMFQRLVGECEHGGRLRADGLAFFAGKNIAALLTCQPGIQQLRRSLKNIDDVGDDVIDALNQDSTPHTWLPEWQALRAAVDAWAP